MPFICLLLFSYMSGSSCIISEGQYLHIALGQARFPLSTDIQPHVFIVYGKALRREERPRLRIERPDVERYRGDPLFFGALDRRLHKSVSTASPVMGPMHGE